MEYTSTRACLERIPETLFDYTKESILNKADVFLKHITAQQQAKPKEIKGQF